MTLRFVPRFTAAARGRDARRSASSGRDVSTGSACASAATMDCHHLFPSWSPGLWRTPSRPPTVCAAGATACRGRTAFSIYRHAAAGIKYALGWLGVLLACYLLVRLRLAGWDLKWRYYPLVPGEPWPSAYSISILRWRISGLCLTAAAHRFRKEDRGYGRLFTVQNLTFCLSGADGASPAGHRLVADGAGGNAFLVLCRALGLRQVHAAAAAEDGPGPPRGAGRASILFWDTPLDRSGPADAGGADRLCPADARKTRSSPTRSGTSWPSGWRAWGYDTPTIRRRVAEMAGFFGIRGPGFTRTSPSCPADRSSC